MAKNSPNFESTEYHNGSYFENYCWSQSPTEVEVHILLPTHIKSAKQLKIRIDANYISIFEGNSKIVDGKLQNKHKSSNTIWSMFNGRIIINLDKTKENWWDRLFETECPIDLRTIDCTQFVDEMSDESQSMIERIKWDREQKMLNLPTSEEIKSRKLLEKAWNAKNSPFAGQPFDPSSVNFH